MKLRISFVLVFLFIFSFINVLGQKTTITGKVDNNKFSNIEVLLYSEEKNNVGAAKINPDGTFKLTANIHQTDIYKLIFDDGQRLMVCLSPNQQIELELNGNDLSKIKSVKGSLSIEFCKNLVEKMQFANKHLEDSLNRALQTDKDVQFYNEFQSQFKNFFEANSDADEHCIKVAQTIDSLQRFVKSKLVKGKVDTKETDVFIYIASGLLNEIATSYSKYANYMQSMHLLNNYKNNRNPKFASFYESSVDKYLNYIDQRNDLMKNNFSYYVIQIQTYQQFKDSLMLNDLAGKKKEKEQLVARIIELSDKFSNIKETENNLAAFSRGNDGFGKYAMQEAQRKVSTIVQQYQKFFESEHTKRNDAVVNYMLANKSDLAILMFLDNYPRDNNQELHREVIQALHERYPKHPIVAERHKVEKSPATATSVGAMAPDLAFENPDGKIMKLSDLKGKVVLLDFWAAWCGPCRKENPNVVQAYNKYNAKGFEVFSVSLDREKSKWVKAIEDDGLIWPYHVSDLGFWQSQAAKIYGITSIPATFLIGRDGRIIAKNLRGAALENKLKELFD